MRKTLLLCFIHGFKGDDNTFGNFTDHLRTLVGHALPKLNVVSVVYPKFETRGDLKECVGRFRDWLQNKVIDLEVEARTCSPSIDPSVRTILIGHSMGGIVAAETVLEITSEQPVTQCAETSGFMFPYVQGVLAFDTPYLGISPGVVAHGAEGHYNAASTAFTQLSGLVGGLWGPKAAETGKKTRDEQSPKIKGLLPPPPTEASAAKPSDFDAAATPAWQRWGKVAMFAGAAGAIAAGGAAAYLKRDQITEGWSWVGGHLEFVGCLVRGEELKKRLQGLSDLVDSHGLGFADLYTVLGRAALVTPSPSSSSSPSSTTTTMTTNASERTFCNLPKSAHLRRFFIGQVNDAARDETGAHMSMFFPKDNPGYQAMTQQATTLILDWVDAEWYRTSSLAAAAGI